MEIASAAAGEATKSAIVHVEREFGYLIHFRRSTNTLNEKIKQLTATKSDVQAMIDAALRNGELVKETVQGWMTRADLVLCQATELSNEASFISSWFRGWCCGRFSLGRKAQKTIEVMQTIHEEGNGFDANNVSYRKPTQSLKMVGTEDFNAFASRDFTAEKILKAILDDATNLLGVHGMPGVGKTALIKAIAKQVKEEQMFQEVVMVIVSQNPNLIKLQGDIAEKLDLSLYGDNLSTRAERLSERLNQDTKTTLVLLDDVWEKIKLSEVGIPYKNKGKCCKVVFTTRFGDVCDKMEADTKIEVAILPEEDSWILFQQKSGNVTDSSLARDLLKECKGLPLAIVTLGLALRNKDPIVWADALKQLRKSIYEGMGSVFSSIKLSYDFLKSKSVKICFLFCCLFREDHVIGLEKLLSYVMGEKLLEDVDTYDEARGRLHSIMDILVSSGLLLRDEKGRLMMHDVVRDVAISIAMEDHGFIVKAGRNLSEWPDMKLGNCKRLSMMYNYIQCLPNILIKAPHLQALFLNNNYWLTELPPGVFAEMKCLMTLDLSRTSIESLPPSLSCLQNLNTLLLDFTNLTNLSPIDNLERLEVLSLSDCEAIEGFPEEMGNLSNLKVLDLTKTSSWWKSINPNVISKLHRLEAFHLYESHVYEPKPNFEETDFFREVGSLSRLTSLQLEVDNPELCHTEIPGPWEKLTRFFITVNYEQEEEFESDLLSFPMFGEIAETRDKEGAANFLFNIVGFLRSLWLQGIRGKEVADWVLVLLGTTYYLKLKYCPDLQSVTEFGGAKGMNHNLKYLYLWGCPKMECVINNTGLLESNENAFSNLEKLVIEVMDAFVEICKGTPPPGLLCKLKTLTLSRCHKMECLVNNMGLFESNEYALSNLKKLVIKYMDVFVEICKGTTPPRLLSNLKTLVFDYCNGLVTVIPRKLIHNLLNLESLMIKGCRNLLYVLETEEAESSNISRISEPLVLPIFPNLKKFVIWNVPKIRYVFTMRVARNLLKLEVLKIEGCSEMEVILKYEDGEDIKCDQDTAILPCLKKLTVEGAGKLKSFTNRDLLMEFPSLEDLTVSKCGILEWIPFGTTSMPKLKSVEIKGIPKIRYVFTMRVARNLLKLEVLKIEGCSEMEVILKYEDGEDIKCDQDTAILPCLKKLTVEGAGKLKSFTNRDLLMEFPSLEDLTVSKCGILEWIPFGTTSMPKLKSVEIKGIPKIRYVFTMRVARNLLKLEVLKIEGCSEMEVILKYEDGEDIKCDQDTAILPCLKKLTVEGAGKLKSFTNRDLLMEFPSLEDLTVSKCGILEWIPFGTTSMPKLKSVEIKGIPKIRYVFTMRVARNLLKLEVLKIEGCSEMEVILKYEDGEDIKCDQDTAILPCLKKLTVEGAGKLKSFTNRDLLMEFPSLEDLTVSKCGILEWIPFGTTSMPKLKSVEIKGIPKIRYVFTMRVARNLLKLEVLKIEGCSEMEVILKYEDGEDIKCDQDTAILPCLKKLTVEGAGKLKSFTNRDLLMEFPSLEDLTVSKCGILEWIPFGTTSMPKLKSVEIKGIPKIRYVFTMRVARNLLKLEVLKIEGCSEMEVILKYEDGEDIKCDQDTAILPCLKKLTVEGAGKLKSFTNRDLLMEFPSLEDLTVSKCGILEWIPFGTTSMPKLKSVEIKGIPKIRYVFTMRVARNLLKLEVLKIEGCSEMEVILKYEDGEDIKCNEEFKDTAILPGLKKLTVMELPKLKSFTNQNLVMELPSLVSLEVQRCDILERLPFGTTSVPNLKTFKTKQDVALFDRLEWEDESVKSRLQAIL